MPVVELAATVTANTVMVATSQSTLMILKKLVVNDHRRATIIKMDMAIMVVGMAKIVVSVSVSFRFLTLTKHGFFLCFICLRYRQPLLLLGFANEPL